MNEPIASMRNALLAFYDVHARDLPWRRSADPYAVWVSEIMLQQTRVDTVLRYYDRFLERFPTPVALADASEDEVMAAWSGLGYYRRARLLHAGVREVVARYGGQVPEDAAERRALPGVGRYTAGAIGSIAFDRAEPIVDGNVARVLCRVHAIEQAPESSEVQRRLWTEADALVQGPRPGALNQALMELGATVCTRSNPACERCPIAEHCQARARGLQETLPRPRARKAPRPVALVALLATRARQGRDELWLQRGEGGLFAGLWNLPMVEGRGRRTARALLSESGLAGTLAPRAEGELEHVLTHRRLSVQLWRALDAQPCTESGPSLSAHALEALTDVGVSSLTRRALSLAGL